MVFGPGCGLFIEEIESERVFLHLDFAQQPVAQPRPFFLSDLAFEDGFLHARPVVLARLRHSTKPTPPGSFYSRNVVCNQDEHVLLAGP